MDGNGSAGGSRGNLRKPASRKGSVGNKGPAKSGSGNERTVRRLRLTKALTIQDSSSIADATRRMASRRVDACLLTDPNGLLCGIVTDRDLTLKCVAEGLDVNNTPVSRIMTRNPTFVQADSAAVDALQKMTQGKFRHLPVIENGEVVALLNITKCLYDAIRAMERTTEKGNAFAAAMEGVESQFGGQARGFVQTFRDKFLRPTLSTILQDSKLAIANKSDTVLTAARKMKQVRSSAVIITNGVNKKPIGILTSKDILTRVLALSLKPEETLVEKVMTPSPECVNEDTSIVDALHTMHDGKFLHLPVVDADGNCVACVDVVHLTNGAMSSSAGSGMDSAETSSQLMQRFWDSALALEPPETDDDATSVRSGDVGDLSSVGRARFVDDSRFLFKMVDRKGRTHRFHCASDSLTELVCAIASRLGEEFDPDSPPSIMYDDEEGDKVVISVDDDLSAAVKFAKASGQKGLKLYLDYSDGSGGQHHVSPAQQSRKGPLPKSQKTTQRQGAYGQYPPPPLNRPPQDAEDFSRFERSFQTYTWAMMGVTLVAVTSVGIAAYILRSK